MRIKEKRYLMKYPHFWGRPPQIIRLGGHVPRPLPTFDAHVQCSFTYLPERYFSVYLGVLLKLACVAIAFEGVSHEVKTCYKREPVQMDPATQLVM